MVLLDLRMPVLDGAEATRRIVQMTPAPRVIALTTFDDDASVFEVLRAGALGYLLKDTQSVKLVEAIEAAARGESILQPAVATRLLGEFTRASPARPRAAPRPRRSASRIARSPSSASSAGAPATRRSPSISISTSPRAR